MFPRLSAPLLFRLCLSLLLKRSLQTLLTHLCNYFPWPVVRPCFFQVLISWLCFPLTISVLFCPFVSTALSLNVLSLVSFHSPPPPRPSCFILPTASLLSPLPPCFLSFLSFYSASVSPFVSVLLYIPEFFFLPFLFLSQR